MSGTPLPPISTQEDVLPGLESWRRILSRLLNVPPTPQRPLLFTATAVQGGIRLDWQRVPSANGYLIQRADNVDFRDDEWISLTSGSQTTYFDAFPLPTKRYYRLYATNGTQSQPHQVIGQPSVTRNTTSLAVNIVNQVSGVTSSPTTTAAPPGTTIPDMTITTAFNGRPVLLMFTGAFQASAIINANFSFSRDGVPIGVIQAMYFATAGETNSWAMSFVDTPAAGTHTYTVTWAVNGGVTLTAFTTVRTFQTIQL